MKRTRIPRRRQKPRRKRPWLFKKRERDLRFFDSDSYVTKGGRFRLEGKDYLNLQINAFLRCNGYCECGCGEYAPWSVGSIADRGELSHDEHGSRKSDELNRVKWMRHECHMRSHNAGGKPCPRKAA